MSFSMSFVFVCLFRRVVVPSQTLSACSLCLSVTSWSWVPLDSESQQLVFSAFFFKDHPAVFVSVLLMKRAASASWDVPPSEAWDVPQAPIDYEDDDLIVPPGQYLVNELLEMYAAGVLPATRLCSLCRWRWQEWKKQLRTHSPRRPQAMLSGSSIKHWFSDVWINDCTTSSHRCSLTSTTRRSRP